MTSRGMDVAEGSGDADTDHLLVLWPRLGRCFDVHFRVAGGSLQEKNICLK
ncbi:hypothetical protein X756_32795 [Mesorhizobium sp. LSHC412B00]|nr:hypothetical protein X756_32795 [Mesorhizobium sp. LSHC412B00]